MNSQVHFLFCITPFTLKNLCNTYEYPKAKNACNKIVSAYKKTGTQKIKEETKATIRCIPLNNIKEEGLCIYSGKPSKQRVLFARAY